MQIILNTRLVFFGGTPETTVVRRMLTLKTTSLPYAPINAHPFTGNASITGNLTISGELSVSSKATIRDPTFTGSVELPYQMWNGNISWGGGRNINIDGNSSFNITGSGRLSLYDLNESKQVFSYTTAGGFGFNSSPHALTLPINTCNTQLATTEFVDYLRGFPPALFRLEPLL